LLAFRVLGQNIMNDFQSRHVSGLQNKLHTLEKLTVQVRTL
jgi:hypothetical protein